jgi:homoserine dehydrogenase
MSSSPDRSIGITLLGHGVVGSGVVNILTRQRDLLRRRTGLSFDVRHVLVRDVKKHPELPVTTDPAKAIDDPKTEIILELMGGTTSAFEYVERALRLGKPVVTANKSLLASRGRELFALARKHNTAIAFEASCGGGIPIIDALLRGLVANRIDALVGIVNGTCNTILTRMTKNGWTYADALKEAQRLGFAEADPTLDVSGRDAAQKLALLASLAFNVQVHEADIHIEGIDRLEPTDIQFASDLGYVIKLLAIAERGQGSAVRREKNNSSADDASLFLRVHPTLVHRDDVLAEVSGSFNAISVYGHALGHALFYGRGAGQLPTASAVVSDLVGVALGTTTSTFRQLRVFPDATPPAAVLPFDQLRSRYYLRLTAKDQPGVMAQAAGVLGQHGISLSAIHQRETTDDGQPVPIVITTHLANEGAMQAALRQINSLPPIAAPTVCLRIIDQPKEFSNA